MVSMQAVAQPSKNSRHRRPPRLQLQGLLLQTKTKASSPEPDLELIHNFSIFCIPPKSSAAKENKIMASLVCKKAFVSGIRSRSIVHTIGVAIEFISPTNRCAWLRLRSSIMQRKHKYSYSQRTCRIFHRQTEGQQQTAPQTPTDEPRDTRGPPKHHPS